MSHASTSAPKSATQAPTLVELPENWDPATVIPAMRAYMQALEERIAALEAKAPAKAASKPAPEGHA
jgi:hypothetical protein